MALVVALQSKLTSHASEPVLEAQIMTLLLSALDAAQSSWDLRALVCYEGSISLL